MTKARDLANIISGGFTESDIPNLSASKITSGTLDNARITLDANEIPNLDTAKITTGTLADARVPNLNASKITAGTIATARLGSGTASSSTFLRGDGTYAEAGGGSLVKLSSTTFGTPATAVVFNNSLITSTYDNYKIFVSGLATATDNNDIGILMSVDNGSSFATHVGSWHHKQIESAGSDGGDAGNKAYIPLGSDEESDATGTTNFEMTIYDVNSTTSYKTASGLGIVKNQNGYFYGYRIHGYIASTTAVNYIKVYVLGGANLDKGTVTLYGIAK